MAVTLGNAGVSALMRGGADHAGELGFDQGLVDGLGSLADAVINLRRRECVQDLQQCRLVKGHRALCPFARTIAVVSLTIARWPLRGEQLPHQGPATYTTQWDATPVGRRMALGWLSRHSYGDDAGDRRSMRACRA
jgi:hypothetical protein